MSEAQIRDLMNNPPTAGSADPKFAGRDWQHIAVGELVRPEDLRWVEVDTGVEDATNVGHYPIVGVRNDADYESKLLTESGAPVLLVRASKNDHSAVATFDYRDLTQYLLFATGQLQPDDEHLAVFEKLAKKAHQGQKIPLRDAKSLGNKEPFMTLPHTADLTAAVETFGGGVHRIVILKEGTNHAIGILSQLRLVKFLWENGRAFPIIDQLYPREVKDLGIGSQGLISIKYVVPSQAPSTAADAMIFSGDKPVKEALMLMNNEGVTSLAVVDNSYNVVGNISNVDVKVSKAYSKNAPKLYTYRISAPHQIKFSTPS